MQIRLKNHAKGSKGVGLEAHYEYSPNSGNKVWHVFKVLEVQPKKKRYLISVGVNVMWFIDFRDAEAV
jgi:hypothetical protein